MLHHHLYRTWRWNNQIQNNWSNQPTCNIFLIASERLRLMRWSQRCFQAWDMLALLQWLTSWMMNGHWVQEYFVDNHHLNNFLASAISEAEAFECAMQQPFWWMIHWLSLTWSTILHKRWTPQSNSKCLSRHLNILVLASWLSGIGGCLDTRGWQFDSWRGVLLRATFCSGALLRQPSHRVVLDPWVLPNSNLPGNADSKWKRPSDYCCSEEF